MHAGFLRPLLSGGVPIVDEVCQRPATRRIIALCPLPDRYRPRNNQISHYTPPAETSIHPGQWYYGFTWTIYVDLVTVPSYDSGTILPPPSDR